MSDVLLGVTLPQFTDDAAKFVSFARRVEKLGLDSAFVFDHIWPLSGGRERSILEAWSSLGHIAAATERVRVGTLVTRSSLRHPAVLAKMAATVGEVAPGRTIIGIGSGDDMSKEENESFGIPYYAGADRIEEFRGTVETVSKFLSEPIANVQHDFVTVEELPASPRPSPRPQVWVGGRSDDALEIAGRWADGWNGWGGSPQRFAQDALRVAEFAAASGDRAIELTWGGLVVLAETDAEAEAKLGKRNPKEYVVGGPEKVAARLNEFVEARCQASGPDADRLGISRGVRDGGRAGQAPAGPGVGHFDRYPPGV